jgi:hypothetical protein
MLVNELKLSASGAELLGEERKKRRESQILVAKRSRNARKSEREAKKEEKRQREAREKKRESEKKAASLG